VDPQLVEELKLRFSGMFAELIQLRNALGPELKHIRSSLDQAISLVNTELQKGATPADPKLDSILSGIQDLRSKPELDLAKVYAGLNAISDVANASSTRLGQLVQANTENLVAYLDQFANQFATQFANQYATQFDAIKQLQFDQYTQSNKAHNQTHAGLNDLQRLHLDQYVLGNKAHNQTHAVLDDLRTGLGDLQQLTRDGLSDLQRLHLDQFALNNKAHNQTHSGLNDLQQLTRNGLNELQRLHLDQFTLNNKAHNQTHAVLSDLQQLHLDQYALHNRTRTANKQTHAGLSEVQQQLREMLQEQRDADSRLYNAVENITRKVEQTPMMTPLSRRPPPTRPATMSLSPRRVLFEEEEEEEKVEKVVATPEEEKVIIEVSASPASPQFSPISKIPKRTPGEDASLSRTPDTTFAMTPPGSPYPSGATSRYQALTRFQPVKQEAEQFVIKTEPSPYKKPYQTPIKSIRTKLAMPALEVDPATIANEFTSMRQQLINRYGADTAYITQVTVNERDALMRVINEVFNSGSINRNKEIPMNTQFGELFEHAERLVNTYLRDYGW
jgi:hypothetical protein